MKVWILALALAAAACTSTVAPKHVQPAPAASFDSGQQNSGILGKTEEGAWRVTSHFRDRYNAMVAVYGQEFLPPLVKDAGMTAEPDGSWAIDSQHMVYFLTMNRWRREGRAQKL